jgi:hypothetical protein
LRSEELVRIDCSGSRKRWLTQQRFVRGRERVGLIGRKDNASRGTSAGGGAPADLANSLDEEKRLQDRREIAQNQSFRN